MLEETLKFYWHSADTRKVYQLDAAGREEGSGKSAVAARIACWMRLGPLWMSDRRLPGTTSCVALASFLLALFLLHSHLNNSILCKPWATMLLLCNVFPIPLSRNSPKCR